jgi:hypothetical protein
MCARRQGELTRSAVRAAMQTSQLLLVDRSKDPLIPPQTQRCMHPPIGWLYSGRMLNRPCFTTACMQWCVSPDLGSDRIQICSYHILCSYIFSIDLKLFFFVENTPGKMYQSYTHIRFFWNIYCRGAPHSLTLLTKAHCPLYYYIQKRKRDQEKKENKEKIITNCQSMMTKQKIGQDGRNNVKNVYNSTQHPMIHGLQRQPKAHNH